MGEAFDPVEFLHRAVPVASHEDVSEMRTLLADEIETHGVDATVDDAGNVLATRGSGQPHVVLNTHIDTVQPHIPYEYDAEARVIRGRGSCDAKGPLAALLAAFLATEPGDGRVTLAVTPDEEVLSTGAHHLVTGDDGGPVPAIADADAVVVGEPTALDVCTAAKGRFQGTVTLSGENAHAAEPAAGVNAVGALAPVLDALATFDEREKAPGQHPQLGEATLTPTTVEGGTATNQVPAGARLVVDRRSVPPETADGFQAALLAHLRAAVPDDVGVDFAFTDRETPFLGPWATDEDAAVVRAMREAGAGEVRPFTAATEASYFAEHAPTVVFGPGVLADEGGAVAHAPREYVTVEAVEQAAAVVTAAVDALVG
ncbi:M20/M25/M40 family metallo-hydrolase [Haloarchaeobius iranensis]|uniref:Acetylornithine deacetylase n=1 Tax=Haloarchaeobius iranensis TaxID=996166 RepID=A0A1G9YF64_9EURY|nr:M20/M25/M40 family metallo-hydrolase [Haloarchaeobius iranensis]SDN07697.1 acetylornithine deacetylase [Haloarchaeobius iranensis]